MSEDTPALMCAVKTRRASSHAWRRITVALASACALLAACSSSDRLPPSPHATSDSQSQQALPARPPALSVPAVPTPAPAPSPSTTPSTPADAWQAIDAARWSKPQTKFKNYAAAKARFWAVYADGGTELYCRFSFDSAAAKDPDKQQRALTIEHAYPADRIAAAFGHPDRDCGASASSFVDAKCAQAVGDMHNLWPAYDKTNYSRQALRYADLPSTADRRFIKEGCTDFARDKQPGGSEAFVQPTGDARGDVARALFYMSHVYDLPLDGAIKDRDLLLAWHQADPPNAEEIARERSIRKVQGTWNPLILPTP